MPNAKITAAAAQIGRTEFIGLITALIAINAFAIDIMLPGLQTIGAALGESDANNRQLVITSYFIGFALLQLLFGPLSDRYGRRQPLLAGLLVYCLAAAACLFVSDFEALLVLRFVQGAGAAASAVIATAVVRDRFGGEEMAEILSLVFMVLMISPVIAPSLGQLILSLFDWHAIFAFMAAVGGLAAMWTYLRLPETLPADRRRPFTAAGIAEGFGIVAGNRQALLYILATGIIIAALFGFLNSSQQVFTEVYGLGAWFSVAFAGIGVAMSIGSFINSRAVKRFGMRPIAHGCLLTFIALAALLAALAALDALPFVVFLPLLMATFVAFAGIGANFSALALEPLGQVAGTAASAQGFTQMMIGTIVGAAIGQQFDGSVRPMLFGYLVLGAVCLGLVLIAERSRLFSTPD